MSDTPPPTASSAWTSRRIIFLGIVGAILAASLTAGARLMNARVDEGDAGTGDEKRLADLQAITARAQEIYEGERALPKSLEESEQKTNGHLSVADPETFEVYEHTVLEEKRFEVCARFKSAAAGGPAEHTAGRDCFEVRVE